jgi:hypothetical protein
MTTLTEVFPCFFFNCKANARVKPAKTGHGPTLSLIFVLFYVLFVCICVLYYCHRVATQLQFNILYHIIYFGRLRLHTFAKFCVYTWWVKRRYKVYYILYTTHYILYTIYYILHTYFWTTLYYHNLPIFYIQTQQVKYFLIQDSVCSLHISCVSYLQPSMPYRKLHNPYR